ncbi:hypothetical protein FGG08_002762 [Glutinoglossum americanum]|uniref:Uncharacterized protein n=1 Tax=Glutinoglossum americanum TaxID=1670608 RepID=A0A9P8I8N7_9PEZI|nr:hypothetical protein FGG08_002762 [Glutinoglossum americanum]
MHRCQQADCSSDDSNGSDIESYFDTEDEKNDPNTNPTDFDMDVEGDNRADISWLLDENKDYPLKYYLNQEDEFDESEVTGKKIRGEINRKIHQILRKLMKKHKLIKGKHEKTLAGFFGNYPQVLFNLRYRDIIVTLLRDPNSSPHWILIEFTCLIFADRAFAAPNLISARQLSRLDIRPGYQQLELLLKLSILDVPVFRKLVRTGYGYEISPYEPLLYATLLSLMKVLEGCRGRSRLEGVVQEVVRGLANEFSSSNRCHGVAGGPVGCQKQID